ncbi:hypothetical protein TIFTF001_007972 [Ficus carica]|uniref:Uncharacterized protein n=1 Tax=Ficus carica TaxID=3494 RepID=A0AA88D2G8_FICCA|nr:hypothetical protein TIFTF001_007972 [Ficus carica]
MAIVGTRLMCGPPPPAIGDDHSPIATKRPLLPLQVKKEEGQKLQAQKSFSVSRRDATIFLAAQTLSAVTFWSLEPPAEARLSRSEIKKQILEKLEQLREKAGISKPKDDKEKNPSPQPPPGKVEKLQTPQSSARFLKDPVGPLMEVIIP